MTIVLSCCCDFLYDTLNQLKSLKLKSRMGENVTYLCSGILEDAEPFDSVRAFNPKQIDYITSIFHYTSDYLFIISEIHKHKKVV